jgi:hypothetical protein
MAIQVSFFERNPRDELDNFTSALRAQAAMTFSSTKPFIGREDLRATNAKRPLDHTVLDLIFYDDIPACKRCRARATKCRHVKPHATHFALEEKEKEKEPGKRKRRDSEREETGISFRDVWRLTAVCTSWRKSVIDWVYDRQLILVDKQTQSVSWRRFVVVAHNKHGFLAERRPDDWEEIRGRHGRLHDPFAKQIAPLHPLCREYPAGFPRPVSKASETDVVVNDKS